MIPGSHKQGRIRSMSKPVCSQQVRNRPNLTRVTVSLPVWCEEAPGWMLVLRRLDAIESRRTPLFKLFQAAPKPTLIYAMARPLVLLR